MNNEEYYEEKAMEILELIRDVSEDIYNGTEVEIDNGILTVSYMDSWTENDVPCIQTDVDDFIEGNVDCEVEFTKDYDLFDYIFLYPDGQLIDDIISDIESERDYAIDKGIDKWIDRRREDRW